MTQLEIAVQDVTGAAIALAAGADRVELCAALGLTGGITPSIGAVRSVVAIGLPVHVLIRVRPGGFVYSPAEIETMCVDIQAILDAGAAGVVIGALTADNVVDVPATQQMVEVARTTAQRAGVRVDVTFHRALDVCEDPVGQLRVLADLGIDRVLTSGGAAAAPDGISTLRALKEAGTAVAIMAGGGVTAASIPALAASGVDAVHLSGKVEVPDLGPVGPGGGESAPLEVTSRELVEAAAQALTLKH